MPAAAPYYSVRALAACTDLLLVVGGVEDLGGVIEDLVRLALSQRAAAIGRQHNTNMK